MMAGFGSRLLRCIDRISGAAGWVAGVLCIGLAVLVVGLVIARYLFHWTSNGLDELRWHCFGAIFLVSLGYCLREGGHVRVDIFHHRMGSRLKAGIEVGAMLLIVVPFCGLMTVQGGDYASQAWQVPSARPADHWARSWSGSDQTSTTYRVVAPVEGILRATVLHGEMSGNEGGLEARWIAKGLIPLGFVLLGLQALAHAGRQVPVLLGRSQKPDEPDPGLNELP